MAGLTGIVESFRVKLTWLAASGPVDYYVVARGGKAIARAAGTFTSYTDGDVSPGRTYTYTVTAWADGRASSPSSVQVSIKRPPVAQARLEGFFNVNGVVTSHYGLSGIDMSPNWGFDLQPRCASGPCDVMWDPGFDFKARLKRSGATYKGNTSKDFGFTCRSHSMTTNASLVIHVTRAAVVDGRWGATRFVGTLTFDLPAQLGCRSGHEAESLTGVLVP